MTAENILKNWNKLLSIIEENISSPRKEKLIDFYKKYEERLSLMPASHKSQYHNCFPGGYVDHVLRVIDCAIKLSKLWKEQGIVDNFTDEEVIFSALNHDLGKFGTIEHESYIPQQDQWKKEKLGELYSFNNKLEYMSVPDRSILLLTQNGITYTNNEFLAIKLHDGLYDESNKPYLIAWLPEQKPRTSLVYILHHADMMAARIEFEREWLPKFYDKKQSSVEVKEVKEEPKPRIKNSSVSKMLNSLKE